MAELSQNIKVEDRLGFIYQVRVQHFPKLGFSTAYYNDDIIAQREYNKLSMPVSDDDREWEMWEDSFGEWADNAVNDLSLMCKQHFNNKISQR